MLYTWRKRCVLKPNRSFPQPNARPGRPICANYSAAWPYTALLVPSIVYGQAMGARPRKTAVLMCPMIGFVLMIWAIARRVGRMDEYQRIIMPETFALAAAVTAAVTFTDGSMENAGDPRLSMFYVWGVMGFSWLVIELLRCWKSIFTP